MRNLNSEGFQICMRGPLQISFIRDDLFSSKHTLDRKLQNFPKVPVTQLSTYLVLFFSASACITHPITMKRYIFKEFLANSIFLERLFSAVHVSPCAFACAASYRCGATALPTAQAQNQKHFSEFSQQFSACTTVPDLQQKKQSTP